MAEDRADPERSACFCADPDPELMVVGASYRSATAAVRDRLFVEPDAVPAALAELSTAGVDNAVLLSTCDRIEVIAAAIAADANAERIVGWMARRGGFEPGDLSSHLYRLRGEAAVTHLFAVTASLDSLVIGEPQVLGQVKASHRRAQAAAMADGVLDAVFQAAFSAAKRVRTDTAIGQRPVSMAAAALQLVRDIHGDPRRCSALFVGLSEMSTLIRETLTSAGLNRLAVTHPTTIRAERQALAWGCHAFPFADLDEALVGADVIVAAVGSRTPVLTKPQLKRALRTRRQRPMFLIDAAVPGDVDTAAESLDGVFRFDLNDLEAVADAGRAHRQREAAAAWQIIHDAAEAWKRSREQRSAIPVLTALRQHVETARLSALDACGGDADKATRLLARRLLHDPSTALRQAAATGPAELALLSRVLRHIFGLGSDRYPGPADQKDWP